MVNSKERIVFFHEKMKTPIDYFSNLEDPRVDRTKEHLLEDIIFITIASVIYGAETWNDIENNRIALNLLKNDKSKKRSIKGKRLDAGWDNDYLIRILKNQMRLPWSAMTFSASAQMDNLANMSAKWIRSNVRNASLDGGATVNYPDGSFNTNLMGYTFTGSSLAPDYDMTIDYKSNATGIGCIFGIDYKPTDKLNVAIHYETRVKLEFEADDNKGTYQLESDGTKSRRDLRNQNRYAVFDSFLQEDITTNSLQFLPVMFVRM